jgi:hypothetical protein
MCRPARLRRHGSLSFLSGGTCHDNGGGPSQPITRPWLNAAAKAWGVETLIRMTSP